MRQSKMLLKTVKETPADAQVMSHRLMMRTGMIRKVSAGIYSYLPLGWRVFEKVARIVREEMNRAGAQELRMPAVQPGELWEESGRWKEYGPELLRFEDRKGAKFCLGPTHEEVITTLVKSEVRSYKQLPLNLYQVQTKFRDEIRPRFGLMRGREFTMKDAYSFDATDDDALKSYDVMFDAYNRIFARMGLDFRPVEADTGAIGGARSHEFQVIAETGEDAIVVCESCNYAANIELAALHVHHREPDAEASPAEIVETPGKKSIDAVSDFLGVKPETVVKSMMFLVDDKPVMALCLGHHEINAIKLKRALNAGNARLMADSEIAKITGSATGYLGPVELPNKEVRIVSDHGVMNISGAVVGANQKGHHRVQVAHPRDFDAEFFDLRSAEDGDGCGRCGGTLRGSRGIEVGHVFFLGTKYSEALGATVQNESGEDVPLVMGCYGIGITRTAAAAIEQNHDKDGILWPAPIAPFHVSLLQLGSEEEVATATTKLYDELVAAGVEVLFDDRDERPGVKFKDADLIGCPLRVSVGKRGLAEGLIEVKRRNVGRDGTEKVAVDKACEHIQKVVNGLLEGDV